MISPFKIVMVADGALLIVGGCTYPINETIGLAMLLGGVLGAFVGAAFKAYRAWRRRRCSKSS